MVAAGARERAVVLREQGGSVDEIAAELGVSKATAYLWVRHAPLSPEAAAIRRRAAAEARADAWWGEHRRERAEHRAQVALDAEEAVGIEEAMSAMTATAAGRRFFPTQATG